MSKKPDYSKYEKVNIDETRVIDLSEIGEEDNNYESLSTNVLEYKLEHEVTDPKKLDIIRKILLERKKG